jgi:natural product precursor
VTKTTTRTKKLTLNRETIRTLSSSELRLVAGGRVRNNCTVRWSGCL